MNFSQTLVNPISSTTLPPHPYLMGPFVDEKATLTAHLTACEANLGAQRAEAYQAVEREHAAKRQLVGAHATISELRKKTS